MIVPASGKFQPNKLVPSAVFSHKPDDNTDAFGSPANHGYHGNPHYSKFGQTGENLNGSMSSNLVGFHNQPTDQLKTNINNAGNCFLYLSSIIHFLILFNFVFCIN